MIERVSIEAMREREIARFVAANPKSKAHAKSAQGWLQGGLSSPFPIVAQEASGAKLTSVDAQVFDDFCLGDTASMFGHSPAPLAKAIAAQIAVTENELTNQGSADALAVAKRLKAARMALIDVVEFVVDFGKNSPNAVFAGSVPYLMLAGNVVAGWQMARSLLAAQEQIETSEDGGVDVDFMKAKITTARFYADHLLTKAPGMRDSIVEGADCVTALALEAF